MCEALETVLWFDAGWVLMGCLMVDKKWYNHFVSFDSESVDPNVAKPVFKSSSTALPPNAAQRVAEIAASLGPPPKFKADVSGSSSFAEIYAAAEIPPVLNGYTVFKVAEMLQSPHIKDLPAEVKRSSVLVALDAAGVKLQSVIEDAVRRDRALDTFESVQLRGVEELEAAKNRENQQIQAAMEKLVAEHQARLQANRDAVAKARERFEVWRTKKQAEEQRIYDAVAPFVSENPVSTASHPAPPGPAAATGKKPA